MIAVLDASALLAYLQNESGGEVVETHLSESYISSVNWAEVVQKAIAANVVVEGMRSDVEALGLGIVNFDAADAEVVAEIWQETRPYGLSLAIAPVSAWD
jgi:ribonuclease VapC